MRLCADNHTGDELRRLEYSLFADNHFFCYALHDLIYLYYLIFF
ncbi:hypothetical protein OIU79_010077, partial [Salix purpurea]